MKLHGQCLNFCRAIKKEGGGKGWARNVNPLWGISMEIEGPVAHAVLGCLCWFFSLSPRDSAGFLLCLQSLL